MPIVIQSFRPEHETGVREFNDRLQSSTGDRDLVFYPTSKPGWLPKSTTAPVYNEYFVAVEGASVRGGYALKHEQILVRGKGIHQIACYHHPLSEGIINRAYAQVGGLLLRDALSRQPLLYALGMGGYDRPLPKMLKLMGFTLTLVPFYFRVLRPYRFLTQIQALRGSRWRRWLMNIAAASGLGWLAIRAAQEFKRTHRSAPQFNLEEVEAFSSWADKLWSEDQQAVSMAAIRDQRTLQLLYPASDRHLTRVRVSRQGGAIGWAVVGERRRDAKFGSLRVGSIVDCWAAPEDTGTIVRAAAQTLEKKAVDMIVSNQAHQMWCRAFESAGFLKGPSNFIFAASKALAQLLAPFEENRRSFHITRADGDGLPRNF